MDLSANELEPWLVLHGEAGDQIALWRVQHDQQPAIALFSQREAAETYARTLRLTNVVVLRPNRIVLIKVLADAFAQGIQWAALDPDQNQARSLFDLRAVLKAAKQQLRQAAENDS